MSPLRPILRWLRANLFRSWGNALVTLVLLWGLLSLAVPLLRWGVADAVWSGTARDCRAAGGACWAFIDEKLNFILFGTYPADQLWRPTLVVVLFK